MPSVNGTVALTARSDGVPDADVDTGVQGFLDRASTTISFNGDTLTLADAGSGWTYYRSGIRHTITGNKTISLGTIAGGFPGRGTYYVYIDSTDGSLSGSFNAAWTLTDSKVPVAVVHYNPFATPDHWLVDKRHGCSLTLRHQFYLHHVDGSKVIIPPVISGHALLENSDEAKTFGISESSMLDQDLLATASALTDPNGTGTPYVVWYRDTAQTWTWVLSKYPFPRNIGNANDVLQFDNGGTMADSTGGTGANTRYVNSYLLLTNFVGNAGAASASRYVIVPGRAQFTSQALATAEDIAAFDWTGFPIAEAVICYRLTWRRYNETENGKCTLAAVQAVKVSTVTNPSAGSNVNHETLSGLLGGAANDHQHLTSAQYTAVANLATNYAARTHASAHAGAATYNVDRTITGGAGGAFTAATINLPAGNYTLNFAYAPAGAAESFTNIDLVAAGATWGTPNVSGFATPTAISNGYRLTIESTPAQLEVSLSHTSAIALVVSGVISESGKTAEFDISAVVTAGADPVTVKSSQIVDAGYGSCVALLDSNATLPLANGGTGAATAGAALTNLGGGATGVSLFKTSTGESAATACGLGKTNSVAFAEVTTESASAGTPKIVYSPRSIIHWFYNTPRLLFGVDFNGLRIGNNYEIQFSSNVDAYISAHIDAVIVRDAAGILSLRKEKVAQALRIYDTYTSATDYHRISVATARATLSNVSGASVTATGLIPAGSVVVGVTSKVTTALGTSNGTTGYQVGLVADPDRWADKTGTEAGTSTDNRDWTAGTVENFAAATDVVVTAKTANFDGTGVIYLSVQYLAGQCD